MNSPSVIRPEARASWSYASLEAKEGTGVGGNCIGWPVGAGVAGGGGVGDVAVVRRLELLAPALDQGVEGVLE